MNKPMVVLLSSVLLGAYCASMALAADTGEIADSARKKGMKEAPDLIKKTALVCSVTDARQVEFNRRSNTGEGINMAGSNITGGIGMGGGGTGGASGGMGGSAPLGNSATQYELACTEGLGYIVTVANKVYDAVPCLELEGMSPPTEGAPTGGGMGSGMGGGSPFGAGLQCRLPGNANQTQALVPFVAKSGIKCDVSKALGIGRTAKNSLFEIACADQTGYILATSLQPDATKTVEAIPCADLPIDSRIQCVLTDPKTALMVADTLMAKSGKVCQVTDRRFFGDNAQGEKFYEVSCSEGTGYIVQQTAGGEFGQAVTCAEIGTMAGGCKLVGNKQ
jgi:hypothetical protein